MNNKKINIMIISLICIIILILLVLLSLNNKNSKIEGTNNIQTSDEENIPIFKRTTDTKIYYTVDERIKAYLTALKNQNSDVINSYLNEEYVTLLNNDNIFEKIELYDNYNSYITLEMYELNTNQYAEYVVKSKIDGKLIFLKVGLDKLNKTFDIYPINETEYENKISEQIKIEEYENKTIKGKKHNFFNYIDLDSSEELIARLYYAEYIRMMLVDSQEAYNFLDTEYKNARFDTYEKFKDFINNNKEKLQIAYRLETSDTTDFENYNEFYNFKQKNDKLTIKSYSVEKYDEYTQYICADGYDHYYIFNVKYPGEYTAFLDTYTVKPLKLAEKYNNMSDKEKVATNCNLFIQMINSEDYESAYKLLDDTFKQEKFNNIETFKKYVTENLYEHINVYNSYEIDKINNYYTCEFPISDENSGKQLNIVMQLKDNMDFVMSFNIE